MTLHYCRERVRVQANNRQKEEKMFFIDLAAGDITNSSGEKIQQPIHFTGFQQEEFEFSFFSGNEPFILPENCNIILLGDIAEHYNTPMMASFGTIAEDRTSAVFTVDTMTSEYDQRVKASSTPCFVDICLQYQENDFCKRLIRFNAIADRQLTLNGRPPQPLTDYYTSKEIDTLLKAWNFDLVAGEVKAVMLESGESPYANISLDKEVNQYKLNFSIAIPAGSSESQGEKGEKGDKGDTGDTGPQGEKGADGSDGYTPVRGLDYWTADDITEIKNYIDNEIINGVY